MRKILGLVCLLALYHGVMAGYAAAQGKTVRSVPPTTTGSPIPPGAIKLLGPDSHSLGEFRAQNLLTSEMNQTLRKERAGIRNGTIDTVPYFDSWFITGTRNSIYPYSMVGHDPARGGTTGINSQVIPLITVLLLGGVPVYSFDPTAVNDPQGSDISLIGASPLYDATTTYPGNGRGLKPDKGQVIDTAQRAEFTGVRRADWHTHLNRPTSSGITWIQFLEFNNGDWTCVLGSGPPCAAGDFPVVNINVISNNFGFILGIEAPANSTVPIIVTDFVTSFIPGPGGGCCILGYHTAQTGIVDPAGVLVWTWATFIPQTTSGGFANPFAPFGNDVMVLSHELSELFNDPFVNTNVSAWVDGSASFAQGNLETGDVIEAMNTADVIYNVPLMPGGKPYTYTLQNVALLEWFTRNPLGPVSGPGPGVYSWPNTNVLNNGHNPGAGCGGNPGCWVYGEGSAGFYFGPPY